MRLTLRLAAAALALGPPAAARAQCAPSPSGTTFDPASQFYAVARINGTLLDFTCLITPSADGTRTLAFSAAAAAASYALGSTTASAYLNGFSVIFDPQGTSGAGSGGDPSIAWSIGTRTALGASIAADPTFDFAFAFGMPVARRVYATASAAGGFSVSNANARALEGVSLSPAGSFAPLAGAPAGWPAALVGVAGPLQRQPLYEQILAEGVAATGIGAGTDPCRLRDPNPTGRARQQVCDFDTGDQPLGGSIGSLGMVVQYRQFGVVNGAVTGTMVASPPLPLVAVPEPTVVLLTASGLVGLLCAAARWCALPPHITRGVTAGAGRTSFFMAGVADRARFPIVPPGPAPGPPGAPASPRLPVSAPTPVVPAPAVGTVLLVEDEAPIRAALREILESLGAAVVEAPLGQEGIALAASLRPDLILLDLGLPDIAGDAVCRAVRATSSVPIVVVSARHSEAEKVRLLDAGADDYLTKPFGSAELAARVRAHLRRARMRDVADGGGAGGGAGGGVASAARPGAALRLGELELDLDARTATRGGRPVHLTPIEWGILRTLAAEPGRTLTHRQIFDAVWGREYGNAAQYLRVHVTNMRRKIEPDPSQPAFVVTEPGVGYRLEPARHAPSPNGGGER